MEEVAVRLRKQKEGEGAKQGDTGAHQQQTQHVRGYITSYGVRVGLCLVGVGGCACWLVDWLVGLVGDLLD